MGSTIFLVKYECLDYKGNLETIRLLEEHARTVEVSHFIVDMDVVKEIRRKNPELAKVLEKAILSSAKRLKWDPDEVVITLEIA